MTDGLIRLGIASFLSASVRVLDYLQVLALIFTGKILRWDDPAIAEVGFSRAQLLAWTRTAMRVQLADHFFAPFDSNLAAESDAGFDGQAASHQHHQSHGTLLCALVLTVSASISALTCRVVLNVLLVPGLRLGHERQPVRSEDFHWPPERHRQRRFQLLNHDQRLGRAHA
jgi:hypothetical protein